MTTQVSYSGVRTQPGSPTAKTIAAAAVIALSTAIAAAALAAGIATGAVVIAPDTGPSIHSHQPADQTTPTRLSSDQTPAGNGFFGHID